MLDSAKPYTFDRVVRMVLTTVGLVAVFALLRYLSDVLVPFAAAVVLAYFLNPLVTAIERRTHKRRGFAVAFTLTGLGIVCFALLVLAALVSTYQINRFERVLSKLRADLQPMSSPVDGPPEKLGDSAPTVPIAGSQPAEGPSTLGLTELAAGWDAFRRDAGTLPRSQRLSRLRAKVQGTAVGVVLEQAIEYVRTERFREQIVDLLRRVAVGGVKVINFAIQLLIGATVLLVILLYLIFLLLDYPAYREAWKAFLPPHYRDGVLDFLSEFDIVLRRYFRGQFVIAAAVGVLFAIGFSIIGLPMAVPFGLFIGVLNIVPYLQTVAVVPAVVLALFRSVETDSSLVLSVALVLLIFGIVQFIQDALITPRIMGKATGLSPIAILLGLFVWGKLLGFLGLLLAIPLTCLGIAYYRRLVLRHSEAETSLSTEPE